MIILGSLLRTFEAAEATEKNGLILQPNQPSQVKLVQITDKQWIIIRQQGSISPTFFAHIFRTNKAKRN